MSSCKQEAMSRYAMSNWERDENVDEVILMITKLWCREKFARNKHIHVAYLSRLAPRKWQLETSEGSACLLIFILIAFGCVAIGCCPLRRHQYQDGTHTQSWFPLFSSIFGLCLRWRALWFIVSQVAYLSSSTGDKNWGKRSSAVVHFTYLTCSRRLILHLPTSESRLSFATRGGTTNRDVI